MRNFDVKKLFQSLCGFELELLKYINRTQGEASAPLNIIEAAVALSTDKNAVRRALKRLVESKVLLVNGENFQINEEVFKKEN